MRHGTPRSLPRSTPTILALLAVATSLPAAEPSAPYTPAVGSKPRVAICDALRAYWKIPKTKFVILYLRVHGDWAIFDGAAGDATIGATLRRVDGRWTVAHTWKHGDVPSPEDFTMSAAARNVSKRLLQEYAQAKGC